MKKFKFFLILPLLMMLVGCGMSTEDVEEESIGTVIESIAEVSQIDEDEIKVLDYTLIQESDSKYSGVLNVKYDGEKSTFDVEVLWDHSTDKYTVKWENLN